MGPRDRLLDLIEKLYAGPGTLDGWAPFLEALCAAVNGSGATFTSFSAAGSHADAAITVRTDPAAPSGYQTHWAGVDSCGRSPALRRIPVGTIVATHDRIPRSELKGTAFHADVAGLYDIVQCMVVRIDETAESTSLISINRNAQHSSFREEESELLRRLIPHLRRKVRLNQRLALGETASQGLAHVIDRITHAVLFADDRCRVTFMNHEAETLVAAGDGLTIDDGELRASRLNDASRLRQLLADASANSAGENVGSCGLFALGRRSGRRPLLVRVKPLSRARDVVMDVYPPVAIAVITDPERVTAPEDDVIRTLLGLSAAEARLTGLLARGLTLGEAAIHLRVRTETLRARLKTIFEKTNTHRQADLVRLVLTTAPGV